MGTDAKLLSACAAAWVLVDGQICCAKCRQRQPLAEAEEQFSHAPGCEADEHPRVQLHDLPERER
ncbi:hypothetical protein JFU47_05255 [Pseudomonas sp. TH39(2020)]|uniref:hypothetical protein n=1 Tax=Pseudomonas sp. TH39(2020) TaxID=2796349 RepID=UPI0019135921|nr:hypothetical protein [Pseudomonas sp. TH39(2020)]MBK5396141.1 hypothetical protein [Pseudomonas sp. TH39(2020)]